MRIKKAQRHVLRRWGMSGGDGGCRVGGWGGRRGR